MGIFLELGTVQGGGYTNSGCVIVALLVDKKQKEAERNFSLKFKSITWIYRATAHFRNRKNDTSKK